ncbi:endonuclease III [Thalassoroseus pseudoceratinae]|uniref:endonuclease III n=1 Tax=Thalassoroseus pseudoceratinae TaxID=2713176 RepID=UPI00141DFF0F|nr:endonuclease III [Thalassoroseus pseudoceratinae]
MAKKQVKKKTTKSRSSAKKTKTTVAPIESLEDRQARAKRLYKGLKKTYPEAECALLHETPFQLLVATILSAQCTDERVNSVTPSLFEEYPTPEAMSKATQEEIESIIKSLGFFRNKAQNLLGMANKLVHEFDSELPRTLDEMISLPGVGRKTANVVLGTAFGLPTGVVVDTHVKRLSNRFGLTASQNPEIIERDLMAVLPESDWIMYSHRAIHHGRQICKARKAMCLECPLLSDCPRVGLPDIDESA